MTIDLLVYAVFAGVAGYFGYRFLKHGGLRGALYGSAVSRTVGEIDMGRRAGRHLTLRVHVLANGNIVVEQAARAPLGASIQGVPMDPGTADRLIELLKQART
jgi:hypothetical protein